MTIKDYLKKEFRELYRRAIVGKADKVTGATAGDLVKLDASGNIADSGLAPSMLSIFPDMDSLTPVQTIEYDVSNNRWNKLFERANPSGTVASAVAGAVTCRITVTGTGMTDKQVTDIVFILPGKENQKNYIFTFSRTPGSGNASTYGIYMARGYWAKTMGSDYGWGMDYHIYSSSLPRHLKIEIYNLPSGVSFVSQETASTSSTTYQNFSSNYNWNGLQTYQVMEADISGQSNRAVYISGYLPATPGNAYHKAGEAIPDSSLVFQSTDLKFYKASTTNKAINTDSAVMISGSAAENGILAYATLRTASSQVSFSGLSTTNGTFVTGDEVFLRCSLSNGQVFSDGVLTNAVSADHTWISIGWATSSTHFALNSTGKVFFTLDANGKLTHINGREIAGGSAGGGTWGSITGTLADQTDLASALGAKYEKPSGGIPAADIASGVIPTVPTISTDITTDATSDTKTTSPKAVKTFVEGKGYGTYSKPSGGIPKTDLASAVQTSLGLADTAVQPEAGKGLFSGNYNDLSNKPTIPTVPTIDTSIDNASSNTDTAGAKAVYDAVHPATGSSQPSGGMLPNVLYNLGTLSGNTTFAVDTTNVDSNVANHYFWTFDTPSTAPTITWPAAITSWFGDSAPTINASKHYEVSLLDGVAICMEV